MLEGGAVVTTGIDECGSVLSIPVSRRYIPAAVDFTVAAVFEASGDRTLAQKVAAGVRQALGLIVANQVETVFRRPLQLGVTTSEREILVTIANQAYPIYDPPIEPRSNLDTRVSLELRALGAAADEVEVRNLGRKGQVINLHYRAVKSSSDTAPPYAAERDDEGGELNLRALGCEDANEISRLFTTVYGYNYISETVYYPERIREMMLNGDLVSHGAVAASGRVYGHVGLIRLNRNPVVYEVAWGLTDPNNKSKGLFTNLFGQVMDQVKKTPMDYCVFDFVTNHVFSQRLVSRYGYCDLAINIGSQISETQARLDKLGMGKDSAAMDRYSILLGVKPVVSHPFGREVTLPTHFGTVSQSLLEQVGLKWVPAPRFYPLPSSDGDFTKTLQTSQKAVYFDLCKPGFRALERIVEEWRILLRSNYQYAAVDMSLDVPGAGQVYDYLAAHGFFIAGFVPYRYSSRLGVRLQSIAPTRVAFEDIQIFSEKGRRLLTFVRSNYEQNCIL